MRIISTYIYVISHNICAIYFFFTFWHFSVDGFIQTVAKNRAITLAVVIHTFMLIVLSTMAAFLRSEK